MVQSLVEKIINAVVSAILLIILLANLIYFYKREHKFERGFKLIFVTLSVGLLCKNVYCGIVFYIDWSKHTEDNLKLRKVRSLESYLTQLPSNHVLLSNAHCQSFFSSVRASETQAKQGYHADQKDERLDFLDRHHLKQWDHGRSFNCRNRLPIIA